MAEFKTIQKAVHELAKEKGWHTVETSLVERIALVHCELSEAVECIRNDEPGIWQKGKITSPILSEDIVKIFPISDKWSHHVKPEGVLVELADAVIRVMDICESQGWDLEQAIKLKHEFNKTRPYRHGGKVL